MGVAWRDADQGPFWGVWTTVKDDACLPNRHHIRPLLALCGTSSSPALAVPSGHTSDTLEPYAVNQHSESPVTLGLVPPFRFLPNTVSSHKGALQPQSRDAQLVASPGRLAT